VRRLWVLVLGLGLGLAQTWYYEVPPSLTPANVYFQPSVQDMLCAAVLAPPTGGGQLNVTNLPRPAGCPASPPVVVYGEDDHGQPVYGVELAIKFWGERRYQDRRRGVKALIRLLKNGYTYRILAQGDLAQVHAEYHPPFTQPPLNQPPPNGPWQGFAAQQDLQFSDAEIQNATNYNWWDSESQTCLDLFNSFRCWSATLVWALPVRSVLHGGERGNFKITLTPEYLHARARALYASPQGRLERGGVIKPFTP